MVLKYIYEYYHDIINANTYYLMITTTIMKMIVLGIMITVMMRSKFIIKIIIIYLK